MGVPKRKRSRARRDSRLAHKGISVKALATCNNCQATLVPHQLCSTCGFYKGVKVATTKLERSIKRTEARKAHYEKREAREKSVASAQTGEGSAQ